MRILFCNIAWMREYTGNEDGNDPPMNGGSYVNEHSDAHEKYNFSPVKFKDDEELYCLGFYETKSHNGEKVNQMRIENIVGCGACKKEKSVDDVLVIYCAKHPFHNFTTIVGWYNHATVYRDYQEQEFDDGYIQYYNMIAKAKDCVLLPVSERSRILLWQAPRKGKGWKFGFGRANVWYASEDDERLDAYLKKITKQIEDYSGENWIQY